MYGNIWWMNLNQFLLVMLISSVNQLMQNLIFFCSFLIFFFCSFLIRFHIQSIDKLFQSLLNSQFDHLFDQLFQLGSGHDLQAWRGGWRGWWWCCGLIFSLFDRNWLSQLGLNNNRLDIVAFHNLPSFEKSHLNFSFRES